MPNLGCPAHSLLIKTGKQELLFDAWAMPAQMKVIVSAKSR
jgi:hypothetical protein